MHKIIFGAVALAAGIVLYYNGDLGITVPGYGPDMAYAGIALAGLGVLLLAWSAVEHI